ncbi:response regulator transcription factor [Patescibacteria group bacterium]|nr:response regulator transcription factor [Patescibacteria group bacterium]
MRILIIEDEEKLAQSLKNGLGKEGYAVDCVFDGETGAKRIEIEGSDYDLIILDLMLPRKNGLEICQEVRQKDINVPILMLTVEDRVTGLDLGADDYLVKPFAFEELLARIRTLLRRPRNNLLLELKYKDINLNPATRKVYVNNKEIDLTTKEFNLLEYFLRNTGQVLTREDLLNHLWDFNFSSFSNVIDVHMKNLRKKIDNGKKDKLFETIRGVGYRLKT